MSKNTSCMLIKISHLIFGIVTLYPIFYFFHAVYPVSMKEQKIAAIAIELHSTNGSLLTFVFINGGNVGLK